MIVFFLSQLPVQKIEFDCREKKPLPLFLSNHSIISNKTEKVRRKPFFLSLSSDIRKYPFVFFVDRQFSIEIRYVDRMTDFRV